MTATNPAPAASRWMDDAFLAEACKRDYAAFDVLYRRYAGRVYGYCYAHTSDEQAAEDLTAETFLAALEAIGRYRECGSFAAWLFSIARRKCSDYHRRGYRRRESGLGAAAQRPDGQAPDPEQQAYHSLILDCVRRALPALTEDRQEVIRLRFWAGLNTAETAAAMGRGTSAVKMLLLRAVNDLRERCLVREAENEA